MDLAVNIAIGSSAQIALFVAPVLVLLSFVVGPAPMALVFNGYELGGAAVRRADRQPGDPGGRVELVRGRAAAGAVRRARPRLLLRLSATARSRSACARPREHAAPAPRGPRCARRSQAQVVAGVARPAARAVLGRAGEHPAHGNAGAREGRVVGGPPTARSRQHARPGARRASTRAQRPVAVARTRRGPRWASPPCRGSGRRRCACARRAASERT